MSHRSWLLVASLLGCWVLGADVVLSDTVYLRNGNFIDGVVQRRSATGIELGVGTRGKLEIPSSDILRIEKNGLLTNLPNFIESILARPRSAKIVRSSLRYMREKNACWMEPLASIYG